MNRLIGLFLIVASGLKAWEFFHDPSGLLQVEFGHVIIPFVIAGELEVGLLALSGIYWWRFRFVAMALFVSFAAYSLWFALHGATSCGCFGPVKMNPWWTLGLDLLIVAGLVAEWWWEGRLNLSPNKKNMPSPSLSHENAGEGQENGNRGEGLWKLAGIGGVSCALFLVLLWQTRPEVHPDGLLQTASGLTILEPTDWSGQPFPLTESIDVDLSQGDWLVVLHRHDCHDCQEAVPLYEELAASDAGKRVALVEVPPFAEEVEARSSACVVGRLTADHKWFVQTPVEIRLLDGIVQSASTELPGITSVARLSVSYVESRTGEEQLVGLRE